MYLTNQTEKYCYVTLDESNRQEFLDHFGLNGIVMMSSESDYPDSYESTISQKINRFMLIRPRD